MIYECVSKIPTNIYLTSLGNTVRTLSEEDKQPIPSKASKTRLGKIIIKDLNWSQIRFIISLSYLDYIFNLIKHMLKYSNNLNCLACSLWRTKGIFYLAVSC